MSTVNMAAYMFGLVGETERALQQGRRAIELARADNELRSECISRQRAAPVLKWARRDDAALWAHRLGIEQCGRIDNQPFVGMPQHGLADLLRNRDRTDEALELATQPIEVLGEDLGVAIPGCRHPDRPAAGHDAASIAFNQQSSAFVLRLSAG